MATRKVPAGGDGNLRVKLGEMEAILRQCAAASAFGDRGYNLIRMSLVLSWSIRMATIITAGLVIYTYGPPAIGIAKQIFKLFHH